MADRYTQLEKFWNNYMVKLKRLDELISIGQLGSQLRVTKKAVEIARNKLEAFDKIKDCPLP